MPRRGANEARVLTWRRWTRPHANPGRATLNRRWMRPPWPLGASTRSSSSHLSERGERRETQVRRDARGGRDGVARERRGTRGAHRDEDSDTVETAAVGEAKGVDGAATRFTCTLFIKPASKIISRVGRWARIGRNCRCLTHIDAAVGHGRRRRRPLERPRRHGPSAARYTRGNPDKLDVTLTRHAHSRRSSHPRV